MKFKSETTTVNKVELMVYYVLSFIALLSVFFLAFPPMCFITWADIYLCLFQGYSIWLFIATIISTITLSVYGLYKALDSDIEQKYLVLK